LKLDCERTLLSFGEDNLGLVKDSTPAPDGQLCLHRGRIAAVGSRQGA
jgi:hypothetical protein